MTRADVHAAATAPDARKRWGGVRVGRLHALEAYRFVYPKMKRKGSLSAEEQVKFQSAKQAEIHRWDLRLGASRVGG